MGNAENGGRKRIRPALLVLLWFWAICIFFVLDLFLNVTELDAVRPRSRVYEGMREAAHELVGERYKRPAELESDGELRLVSPEQLRLDDLLASLAESPSADTARLVATLASSIGPAMREESRDAIAELLFDIEPPELRASMGLALTVCKGDEALALYLLSRMDAVDAEHTLPALCTALGGMQAETVVPGLLVRLEDADGARRRAIIGALGGIGGEAAEQGLIDLLGKELDHETRFAVVQAWPKDGVDRLAAEIDEVSPAARAAFVQILGRTRDEKFVPAVLDTLAKSKDNAVIRSSLRALGHLGDKAAVERLLEVRNEPNGVYADAAQEAMQWIRNAESLELIAGRWEELSPIGHNAALLAVAELPELTETLRRLALRSLEGEAMQVRTAAAWALGRRGAEDAVGPLETYLKRAPTDYDRLAAVQALGRIESKKAAEAGLAALRENPGKRDFSDYVTMFERLTMNG
ncbi:MAG: HEAT repeat domain-containing protein [Planctomycetota bacterium]|jgi:HEAT repeat protein